MFSTTWNKQWYLYSVKHVVPKVLSNALSSIRTFIKDCVQKIYRRISENNRPPVQQEHYRLLRLSGVDQRQYSQTGCSQCQSSHAAFSPTNYSNSIKNLQIIHCQDFNFLSENFCIIVCICILLLMFYITDGIILGIAGRASADQRRGRNRVGGMARVEDPRTSYATAKTRSFTLSLPTY